MATFRYPAPDFGQHPPALQDTRNAASIEGIRGADVEARKKAYLQLLQDSISAFLTQRASERPAPASDDSDDEDDDEEDLDEDDDATLVIEQAQDPGQEPQPRPPPHDPGPAPPPSTRKRTSRPSTDAN